MSKNWLLGLIFCALTASAAEEFAWIEAETPNEAPQVEGCAPGGWGNVQFLSGGKVLSLNIPEGQGEKRLGKEGIIYGYDFELKSGGKHQVWARIGFESVRADFDWRVDSAEWKTCRNTDPTCDLMPLAFWNEIAWIMLGEQELAGGKHKLQIRHVPQTRKDKDKVVPARTLNYTDCYCIYKGNFRPNSKYKPGEEFQTEDDRKAGTQVFEVSAGGKPEERAATSLTGPWQIARWDEAAVKEEERLEGEKALPENLDQLFWFGIAVPSDRDKARPDLGFSHRNIFRTKVKLPAEAKDRGVFLDFEYFNMVASVFVNGKLCGWTRACSTGWQCDITPAIKAGEVNDLVVVIKDCYYAIKGDANNPLGTRSNFNLPHDFLHNQGVSMRFDMPICWDTRAGLLEPVTLVLCGKTYVTDAFAKTSVKKKEIALEITVKNPGAAEAKVSIENEVIPWNEGKGGAAAKKLAPKEIVVPAGQETTFEVTEPWTDAKVWWPDDPQLYWAVTKVVSGGKVIDVRKTRFGFREWEWDSHAFKLNGIKWWMWAHCDYGPDPKTFVESAKKNGQNMFRTWHTRFGGMSRRQFLDYFDETGMLVRNSGIFDGEGANYGLSSQGKPNLPLFENWKNQMKGWVKEERNHPCVFIWSVENEITYINSLNLGQADIAEPEVRKGAEMVEKMDPTRPTMVDGGRCLKSKTMPVNGCHYNDMLCSSWRGFPDAAYTARDDWYKNIERGAWEMVPNRPMLHGECFFASGIAPAEYAALDGDHCFVGIAEASHAKALYGKILSEGWRWCEVSAFHFWAGGEDGTFYNSWQPVCVFCRQWNWTFAGGSEIKRTLKVFNSTRYSDPIEMGWQFKVGDKVAAEAKKTFNIPAGEASAELEIGFQVPTVAERTHGEFILTCSRAAGRDAGPTMKEVFREVKQVSIMNADAGPKPTATKNELVVVDPSGSVKARLQKRGIGFTEAAAIDQLPADAKIIVLGKDAVPEEKSTDPMWYNLMLKGTRLLVLEQKSPLHYQAIPADLDVSDFTGRVAFPEDYSHPAFAGLEQKDFFTWSKDHIVYRNAYKKASKGARSLAQCDLQLNYSALAECQGGEGLMLLSQFVIGEKLDSDPVAQRLFDNLLAYASVYKAVRKTTAVAVDAASPKGQLIKSLGLKFDAVSDPLAALDPKYGIAVIDATPENLTKLAGAADRAKTFAENGGWILLWGVTADGLADYNKIVGVEHMIRPFQMERVVFPASRDPLSSGLTLRDIVMDSGKDIFGWMSLKFPAEDEFTSILDYDEVGPFLKFPTAAEMGKPADVAHPGWDHWPLNMVNNYTADDTWRFCYSIDLTRGDKTKWTMELPRAEEITNFAIVLNVIYHKVTKINLYFDDDPMPFTMNTRPTHDRQEFAVPNKKAKKITMELAEWEKSGTVNVIGIDNFWISVKRSPEFLKNVRPLLNIGGLLRYNKGQGGILTNQLNIVEHEKNPINAEKKATITKTLLKNLGATFEGGGAIVVGANLKFTPVKFAEGVFNAYLKKNNKAGWFANHKVGDMSGLPTGENKFAGVTYSIADFRTSPVPSCCMLQGHFTNVQTKEIKGIAVNQKADALFFLHTFNAKDHTQRWKPEHNRLNPPTVFKYVVHFAGSGRAGTPAPPTAEIPVVWNQGVGHWLSKSPKSLMNAPVAWASTFQNDTSEEKAVLYSMQWDNPHPELAIEAVDFTYSAEGDQWGAPALVGITGAVSGK
ncbi:MAG TPA: glycoside hydrolase family 2 TIM barrel-domain containing protein [Planctomycetota bacterium]|jgi:beta-galactosidase